MYLNRLLGVLLLFPALRTAAQDAHYWASTYNPASLAVPGGVIANTGDSGVFYYNPALLAFSRKNSFTVSGTVYQLQSIKIRNGVGAGKDLTSTSTGIVPQMVAGCLTFKAKKPIAIGYALLQDPVINFRSSQQRDEMVNALSDVYSPGPETYLGQADFTNTISETKGLLSVGMKASNALAIGITFEGLLRKQNFSSQINSRAIFNTPMSASLPPFANAQQSYLANYLYAGLRFKLGVAYDAGRHHLGAMVTSPLTKLYGRGMIQSDYVANNIITEPGVDTFNILANSRQEKLKVRWKTPVSFSLGYAYDYGRGNLYVVGEYFMKVGLYNVIQPGQKPFIRPVELDGGYGPDFIRLKAAKHQVLNVGIGFSYLLRKDLMLFFGGRTDFKNVRDGDYADNAMGDGYRYNTSDWNLYHADFGLNVKKRKFNLRATLLLTYGTTKSYRQFTDFGHPLDTNFLDGEPGFTSARNLSAGVLFSYIHNI